MKCNIHEPARGIYVDVYKLLGGSDNVPLV